METVIKWHKCDEKPQQYGYYLVIQDWYNTNETYGKDSEYRYCYSITCYNGNEFLTYSNVIAWAELSEVKEFIRNLDICMEVPDANKKY